MGQQCSHAYGQPPPLPPPLPRHSILMHKPTPPHTQKLMFDPLMFFEMFAFKTGKANISYGFIYNGFGLMQKKHDVLDSIFSQLLRGTLIELSATDFVCIAPTVASLCFHSNTEFDFQGFFDGCVLCVSNAVAGGCGGVLHIPLQRPRCVRPPAAPVPPPGTDGRRSPVLLRLPSDLLQYRCGAKGPPGPGREHQEPCAKDDECCSAPGLSTHPPPPTHNTQGGPCAPPACPFFKFSSWQFFRQSQKYRWIGVSPPPNVVLGNGFRSSFFLSAF